MRRGINKIFKLPCELYFTGAIWTVGENSRSIKCSGTRKIRTKYPQLDIVFPRDIMTWPWQPPVVQCRAPWLRRHIDWHVYSNGELCWCLTQRWYDKQGWLGKSRDAIATDGLNWLFSSIDLLLVRHLVGYNKKMTEWPIKWSAWGHGSEGVREYARIRQYENRHRYLK